ncbi:hypothetical protein OPT61_g5363 [Boeremia exigua]|uniref:Uncharacterized protein n=1 Tax=Boeremia exigua TaxID=749465 RepID=A0ACC2IAQ0_9PLEO|nr:hypothetical protein OPT61_g5363 [Boeremia exigua]
MYSLIVEEGYWREPLDPDLRKTYHGQIIKDFHKHIHPPQLRASEGSFDRFAELPAELQLRVVQQCNAPTLFQLMHTTRSLRIESKKLFFSDRITWYRLDLDHKPQYCVMPGEFFYDVDFLASIEQVDLSCPMLELFDWLPDDTREYEIETAKPIEEWSDLGAHPIIDTAMRAVWQDLVRVCPQLKRIILSPDDKQQPVIDGIRKFAQLCPRGIDVFLLATEIGSGATDHQTKRVLWRLRDAQRVTAIEVIPTREESLEPPCFVVVPPEKMHRGLVGDYLKSQILLSRTFNEDFADRRYRMTAIEQHYFGGRDEHFGRAVADCDAWFDLPGKYTTHAQATGHCNDEVVPERVKALFAERSERCRKRYQEWIKVDRKLEAWWEPWNKSTEHRMAAEKEVRDQLEHDALYLQDKPVSRHWVLRSMYNSGFRFVNIRGERASSPRLASGPQVAGWGRWLL